MRRPILLLILIFLLAFGMPRLAEAISNTETFGGFEFNFNNPGARATGMGGAFTGVADDATAVVSNPAGLLILQRPEISAEIKYTRFTNTTGAFTNTSSEGSAGIFHDRDFDDDVLTPSFFSLVYPTKPVVVAAFARELVNFKSDFQSEGVFLPSAGRLFPVRSELEITALNFGAGAGINLERLHPLLPNLGGTIELSNGVVNSKLQRFSVAGVRFFQPPDYSESNVFSTALVSGSDISYGYNVGLLWRPLKDLAIGAIYRRGPRFEMLQTIEDGPAAGAVRARRIFDFSLKVPDVYGGGVSYRLFERLTLAVDVLQVRYSQLRENFQIVFDRESVRAAEYRLDDATEVHAGAEYVFFIREVPVAVRAGFFRDPDHKIRFTGEAESQRALFPGGKDQYHYTFGFGFVPIQGLQLDFAANLADRVKEFVLSTVYRF